MSISNALSNATLGLAATSRLADTISNNVANALTPGFARRSTELSSLALAGYGAGVKVSGTVRAENVFLTAERRSMDAAVGLTATLGDVYERMMAAIGEPGSATALATTATGLETALMAAVTSPQSTTMLAAAVTAAGDLASSINSVAAENVRLRTEADAEIARQVAHVNASLHAIQDLNAKITKMTTLGGDITGLQDERDRLIDGIASIIPVRTVNRENGQIAVYSQNGGALLDGRVWELSFQQGPTVVTAELTVGAGLSGLAQDQGALTGPTAVTVGAASGRGLMDGGSLSALFQVRDQIIPQLDAELNLYAADLIERFTTLMPAAALDGVGDGLFVDFDPTGPAAGLAGRLSLNATVDPDQGGQVWRLRDGLGAATQGEPGFGGYLQAFSDAMATPRDPTGFVSQTSANTAAGMASEIASFFAGKSASTDDVRAFLTASQAVLSEQESSAIGVNTDAELQYLILVEQAYAANARVMSVIDEMMRLLLEY